MLKSSVLTFFIVGDVLYYQHVFIFEDLQIPINLKNISQGSKKELNLLKFLIAGIRIKKTFLTGNFWKNTGEPRILLQLHRFVVYRSSILYKLYCISKEYHKKLIVIKQK